MNNEFVPVIIGAITTVLLAGIGWLIRQPLNEIRDDVKEMKDTDKELVKQTTALQMRIEKLEDWRAYHLEVSHYSEHKRRRTDR